MNVFEANPKICLGTWCSKNKGWNKKCNKGFYERTKPSNFVRFICF